MARVALLDPHESDDSELREFASKVTRPDGTVPAHFMAEAHFPAVLMNTYDTRLAISREGELGLDLFFKIAVAVSMANRCQYCTGAYAEQLAARLGGHEEAHAFQEALASDDLRGMEGDVIDFALTILEHPDDVTDEDTSRLTETHGVSDKGLIELIYIVNTVSGYNRLTVTCDLAYDHDYPEEWAAPRPLPQVA